MDKKKLAKVQKDIENKATLVAVSKTRTKEEIEEAYNCGCRIFGENRVQELKDEEHIHECFEKMRVLFQRLQTEYGKDKIKYLSMGMSQDYPIALEHGSNLVRIGSLIFGKRK